MFEVLQYRLQLGKWWPYEEEGRNLTGRALRKETKELSREKIKERENLKIFFLLKACPLTASILLCFLGYHITKAW